MLLMTLNDTADPPAARAETPELVAERFSAGGLPAGFSIVDAHIHLWDLTRYPVPWIAGNAILNQSYVLKDFKDQSAGLATTLQEAIHSGPAASEPI